MNLLRRLCHARSGASAVEFAVVVFPFFLVVFGTLEFGRAMWTRETLHAVAIAGARCMGMVQSGCGASGTYSASLTTSYVQTVGAQWGVTLGASDISVPSSPTLRQSGTCAGVAGSTGFSVVSLTYSFQTAAPKLLSYLVPLPITVSACFPNQT